MKLDPEQLARLRALVEEPPQQIVIVAHTNPDGDAIGSSLAWATLLGEKGHTVTCIVPNGFPYYLKWMPGIDALVIHKHDKLGISEAAIRAAKQIYCMDFNSIGRLEALGEAIAANTAARRILIDHHLQPQGAFDVTFSHPESSSTSFLVYALIEALYGTDGITTAMAENLYTGMMTDTGNFSFSFLVPELYRAVAVLVEKGLNVPQVYNNVYNSFTIGRARLFGYAICHKMQIIGNNRVAYMSLKEEELKRFRFQQGDSEGFVNYALTVKRMKMSAMFLEHHDFIRISLRSRGNVDVNLFARKYFQGGGHKNAAGGKSFVSMEETIEVFRKSVEEFIADGGLE